MTFNVCDITTITSIVRRYNDGKVVSNYLYNSLWAICCQFKSNLRKLLLKYLCQLIYVRNNPLVINIYNNYCINMDEAYFIQDCTHIEIFIQHVSVTFSID